MCYSALNVEETLNQHTVHFILMSKDGDVTLITLSALLERKKEKCHSDEKGVLFSAI